MPQADDTDTTSRESVERNDRPESQQALAAYFFCQRADTKGGSGTIRYANLCWQTFDRAPLGARICGSGERSWPIKSRAVSTIWGGIAAFRTFRSGDKVLRVRLGNTGRPRSCETS